MTDFSAPSPVLRQLSVRSVIDAILRHQPVSRAEIARQTKLSKQTISEVFRILEAGGWIKTSGRSQGALGRSAVTYEIEGTAAYVLGIDLGGAKIRGAIADLNGLVVTEAAVETDRRGGLFVIAQIGALARRLCQDRALDGEAIMQVVIGMPGLVDPTTGSLRHAPNLPDFETIDVIACLQAELATPMVVDNDVDLAVMGEYWRRAAVGIRNLAFIALGAGFGMGLLINGRLVRGGTGAAGELGFLPLGTDPFEEESHRVGALERAVRPAGILARYEAMGGETGLTVPEVFDRMNAGEPAAETALEETARFVALAIASVTAIVDPELVVLGGSIGLRPELCDRISRILPACSIRPVPVEASMLGSRATLAGALTTGLKRAYDDIFGIGNLVEELDLSTLVSRI